MEPSPISTTDADSKSAHRGNRRVPPSSTSALHSSLILLSTTIAALFCYLYLSAPPTPVSPPIALSPSATTAPAPPPPAAPAIPLPSSPPQPTAPPTLPARNAPTISRAPTHAGLEETNLRVQHVLTAESPMGRVDRIEVNVPILYQSRSLRWTDAEVDQARSLRQRLANYQEQSRQLREEGRAILESWNTLIAGSIPSTALRADSPSLPSNQRDAMDTPRPSGWTSTDLIEIKPSKP